MAKKGNKRKKQQNNQRGYSTTNAVPSSIQKNADLKATVLSAAAKSVSANGSKSSSAVSSQNHQDLLRLLGALDDEDHSLVSGVTPPTAYTSPDRFYKKLYNIHDTLDQLGFSFENIQKAVVALGYDISLEAALDWLCLHLSTQDLPPLLTEGSVREQEQQSSSANNGAAASTSLELLKPARIIENGDESPQPAAPVAPHLVEKRQAEKASSPKKEDSKEGSAKAWILQQYQYEEEQDEEQEEGGGEVAEEVAARSTNDTSSSAPALPAAVVPPPPVVVDPNQKRLEEMEELLRQHEADINDDASNYMRSKQDIKQMQNSTKKLRQQVQGLKKKVEKTRAAAKREAAASAASEDVLDDGGADFGGGIFGGGGDDDEDEGEKEGFATSFFDKPSQSAVEKDSTDKNEEKDLSPPSDPVVPKDSVPSGWTGKTPKEILEDWCKKEKIRKPQFFKLPIQHGARVRVDTKPISLSMQTDNYMGSYADAQQYLSTKVLYQLNPDLPLYRLFPPYHRDLWRSWSESIQNKKEAAQKHEDEAIATKIQQLIDSVPKARQPVASLKKRQKEKQPEAVSESMQRMSVRDCWDDDNDGDGDNADFDAIPVLLNKSDTVVKDNGTTASQEKQSAQPTRAGEAIRKEFLKRQRTSAYQSMLEAREGLPMYAFRKQVLQTIKDNPVTILCAETGAGKTTQCPQFLLEDAFASGHGDRVSVICTQPRRVAATSVAERVSEEMTEPAIGGTVGYSIRMDAKKSGRTRLLFCTTGVILRRLQDDPLLKGVTHICVDEVHERQYQVDCLLVMLRQLLRKGRPDLKIILMSATLDAKLFCSFFGGAPVLNVPGRTFPVSVFHMEDLLDGTGHIIEEGSRYAIRDEYARGKTAAIQISTRGGENRKEVHSIESGGVHPADVSDDYPGYNIATRRSMDRVNEEIINYDLIEDVLLMLLVHPERNETLLPPDGASVIDGSILIFLPGFGEIRSLTERLGGSRSLGNKQKFDVIPMHSTLSPQDQRRAFLKPKAGIRKIILATNIAETSVTIPDVVCVIDAGRVREVRVDKRTSTSRLVTDWCSRASAKQRAGRAGRVQPGVCLKCYSSRTATVTMREAAQPEIRRVPLEDVCLSILAGSFADSCMDFLSQTPQPPSEEAVRSALRVLHDVGAITMVEKMDGKEKTTEQLTALGRHLARLPVDVRLGKMLIFGALFNCIDPVLTVAASLSCKSPFSTFVNDALQAKAKHKAFVHPTSDFLTLCSVWEAYETALSNGMSKARSFCSDNFLSFSALKEIADTRRHFVELLFGIGFLDRSKLAEEGNKGSENRAKSAKALLSSPYNSNRCNLDVVHSVFCAGLYPNVGHLPPNESGSGERPLWHNNERLYFHSSSVNSSLRATCRYPSSWIAFHEMFGTQHRVTVSATCFVHPFAILVFGGDLVVKHTERRVIVDGWIELPMAAQTGVMFREVRKQVDRLLQGFLEVKANKNTPRSVERRKAMVAGIVRLLSTETTITENK